MRQKTTGTITDTTSVNLPNPMSDRVCSYLVQLDFSGVTGAITIQGSALDSSLTLIDLAYKDMNTGTNATGAISANALVLVDAAGLNVVLASTVSAGTVTYVAIPLVG